MLRKQNLNKHVKSPSSMENTSNSLWAVIAVIAIFAGIIAGGLWFPQTKEVTVTNTELKIVEVPVPSETKYEVDSSPSDRAVEFLLQEIDENEDLWECGDRDYDPSQISVVRVRKS